MNTGTERSLTVVVTQKIDGVVQFGYPSTYYGKKSFSYNGTDYTEITDSQLERLSENDYNQRLADFEAYVKNIETLITWNTDIQAGFEASRENITSCPLTYPQ